MKLELTLPTVVISLFSKCLPCQIVFFLNLIWFLSVFRYHESSQMSSLVETFVSKASALQRQGRAGRVRDGFCFRLYPKFRYEAPPGMGGENDQSWVACSAEGRDKRVPVLNVPDLQVWCLHGLRSPRDTTSSSGRAVPAYYGTNSHTVTYARTQTYRHTFAVISCLDESV